MADEMIRQSAKQQLDMAHAFAIAQGGNKEAWQELQRTAIGKQTFDKHEEKLKKGKEEAALAFSLLGF